MNTLVVSSFYSSIIGGHFCKCKLFQIIKLVILCLDQCNDPDVLYVILGRIRNFIVNNELIFQENLEDFLLRILKLTSYEHSMVSQSLII